jgi:hypothetical protein
MITLVLCIVCGGLLGVGTHESWPWWSLVLLGLAVVGFFFAGSVDD